MTEPQETFKAIQEGDARKLDEILDRDPGAAAARDGQGVSLLLQALYHRRPEMAERLAAVRGEEELDLLEAAALGRVERMRHLLAADAGAVHARSPDGFTPLHYSAFFGRAEAAGLLLERGAEVDAEAANPTRVHPLHSAVAGGHTQVVRRLLAAGADSGARQQQGFTPLMGAAAGGHREILELLLAAGADPAAESDDGKTARDLAAERGHPELAERLAAAG